MKNTTNWDWSEKFVSSDLPCPNLAAGDSYGGGGVKISAVGASTTAMR